MLIQFVLWLGSIGIILAVISLIMEKHPILSFISSAFLFLTSMNTASIKIIMAGDTSVITYTNADHYVISYLLTGMGIIMVLHFVYLLFDKTKEAVIEP